ncbi:hypothetical protein ACFQUU_06960 [Herbaspirillum sp. GCM10030257]|uniref:hypothetical protein n=1 Tax=Herbaspirillum sp. GCM10030257 TaxID=3273393 RepID=UPI003617BFA3
MNQHEAGNTQSSSDPFEGSWKVLRSTTKRTAAQSQRLLLDDTAAGKGKVLTASNLKESSHDQE